MFERFFAAVKLFTTLVFGLTELTDPFTMSILLRFACDTYR
jgi:hypothetical protein